MKNFLKNIISVDALESYWLLLKLHQPIATFILLWPILWAVWFASRGFPEFLTLIIFFIGAFLVNILACIVDDIAERDNKSKHAHKKRLLAKKMVSVHAAWILFFAISIILILLMTFLNTTVLTLGITALIVSTYYPFSELLQKKRHIFIAFANAWIVLMVFAAHSRYIPNMGWLFAAMICVWSLLFDTFYKRSDKKITKKDKDLILRTSVMQILITVSMLVIGIFSGMATFYYVAIMIMMIVFFYQHKLVKTKKPKNFLLAYNSNNFIGVVVLFGIILSYLF